MKINIHKAVCDRCGKKDVSKDIDGVTLNFKGMEAVLCNSCAVEFANLIFLAVHNNETKMVENKEKDC